MKRPVKQDVLNPAEASPIVGWMPDFVAGGQRFNASETRKTGPRPRLPVSLIVTEGM